jgi:hypothetical protein
MDSDDKRPGWSVSDFLTVNNMVTRRRRGSAGSNSRQSGFQTGNRRKRDQRPAALPPNFRRLKVFSLDPSADVQLDSALISRSVLQIPWEGELAPGPVGEYLEVVDVDPSSACAYDPVDLNEHALLAQDGLSPSTGNPQFHQQMVYAVAMKTIANFEQVLGRRIHWAERRKDENNIYLSKSTDRYVQQLRIYPHALREQNAYYSPEKKALLFGYFHAPTTDPRAELPGGLVFTCLSHDIVAHETTHAILDGMHRRLLEISNPDMLAFHEAFADTVAIFQHFTLPGLLLDQIQRSRGNLRTNTLLAKLAVQFARATGHGDALRNALGQMLDDGTRVPPDPTRLGRTYEPHERGAILVAAVFDAFVRMYDNRVADLRRIATGGTGVLPDGDIHPDLAKRFAEEASRLAQRVLNISIRALDYLPPVDVTFGDYLRALITADTDFHPDDPRRYRLAFIEAFRSHGIYPLDVRTMAEDALCWKPIDDTEMQLFEILLPAPGILATMATAYDSALMSIDSANLVDLLQEMETGTFWNGCDDQTLDAGADKLLRAAWNSNRISLELKEPSNVRFARYRMERMFASFLHGWIVRKSRQASQSAVLQKQIGWQMGLDARASTGADPRQVENRIEFGSSLEVHAVRPTVRLRADGRSKMELLVMLTQRRICTLMEPDGATPIVDSDENPLTFVYRGGSTLIIDPETGHVRYSIGKNLQSQRRLERHMEFLRSQITERGASAITRFDLSEAVRSQRPVLEPFALAHSHNHEEGTY